MKADPEPAEDERINAICRALSNPLRLQIVRYIQRHPGCIGNQILLNLPGPAHAQSTLSQHLKILCDAGLVEREQEGPAAAYTLSVACLEWLRDQLESLEPR